ncbi:MAG: biotin-dependent carboxyltransferase family protein [Desulfobacter sp.]|nr:MAG: biotin-dependent carboxyltransferase family protein [Desulfobacter sp.]
MNALKIISPGPFTTVQDLGRFGFQQFGVPPCGMLDKRAGRLANILAGNDESCAVLEFTFMGAQMDVLDDMVLAVAGADMGLTVNGRPCRNWAAHRVRPGDRIAMGAADKGCRAYLALSGGIEVPEVMGSRSTYIGARIGGIDGRLAAAGDVIQRAAAQGGDCLRELPGQWIPDHPDEMVLRAVPGPQDAYFDKGLEIFFNSVFTITDKANRMGYRLAGTAVELKPGMPRSIISEPSLPGGVQIPEDGQPIVLLAEQTVGGYAKIATVISTDLDRLAQGVPGNRIRFEKVTLAQAHRIYREAAEEFEEIRKADMGVKSPAAMGNEFFNHPVFRQRIEKYMIQI